METGGRKWYIPTALPSHAACIFHTMYCSLRTMCNLNANKHGFMEHVITGTVLLESE